MTIEEYAEQVRRALDDMNYYEGTQRRDAAIARGIRATVLEEYEVVLGVIRHFAKNSTSPEMAHPATKEACDRITLTLIRRRDEIIIGGDTCEPIL